ncbi:hypothetical protein FNF27_04056 [Cafeteria roenbergensis]|uniref:Uncharacterized protein n=2 Tax=Cafeteria roenbergensis TaxID=33653 RepID=A0A5A8EEV1_CAFRO|nr:hypothetical protein FNF27_04056 [Cafeteria roenbergensis]
MRMAAAVGSLTTRRLWVHLDVNKTLIGVDPASGQDVHTALVGSLGKCVFGRVRDRSEHGCDLSEAIDSIPRLSLPDGSELPSKERKGFRFLAEGEDSVALEPPAVADGATLHSLVGFLEREVLPYMEEASADARGLVRSEVRAANEAIKTARRAALDLVLRPGGAAARFLPHLQAMKDALAVPPALAPAYAASGLSHAADGSLRFLCPAYFTLLQWLARNRPESTVVIRTFGTDLPEVVAEHNAFCEGRHPLYPAGPRLDGSPFAIGGGSEGRGATGGPAAGPGAGAGAGAAPPEGEAGRPGVDFRLRCPEGTGAMLRFADGPMGTAMSTVRVGAEGKGAGPAQVVVGTAAIHEELERRRALGMRAMGIQDHYRWWKSHDEVGEAGKVLLVKDGPAALSEELSVFFDDNIGGHRAKIVDARDYTTGEPVPFSRSKGLFLRKVAMPLVLKGDSFFVDGVRDAERRADAIVNGEA